MNQFKKALVGMAAAIAVMATASAAPINVGGVVWDPDTSDTLADNDFTARFEFNQYFSTGANAVADINFASADYSKAKSPATVGVGDVLQGVGEIFMLNGVSYGSTLSSTGGAFCPSCELTFVFGGFEVATVGPRPEDNTLKNGWLRLYVDGTPDFSVTTPGGAAAASNNDGDTQLFLELRALSNQFVNAGTFSSGALFNYFAVTGGIAMANFDTNTQFFNADFLSSASASFFSNLIATSTGQINGNSIPEPGSLALAGLALLGLGAARRRQSAK